MNPDEYKTLQDDQLRLLELRPPQGGPDNTELLALSLEAHDCAKAPPYVALSYTWGTEEANKTVSLDGQAFPVRPNLHACLFRLAAFSEQWPRFWIDAICIDQSNTRERNEQVSRMATTFLSATTVVAWLGDLADGETPSKRTCSLNFLSPMLLNRLLRQPYWDRMWVVQELRLAHEVRFLWGPNVFRWVDFVPYVNFYHLFMFRWNSLPNARYCRWYAPDHLHSIGPRKRGPYSGRSPPSVLQTVFGGGNRHTMVPLLGSLLDQHRSFLATDPRDRVFALLGLLSGNDREVLGQVFPDYAMPFERVILITMAFLRQQGPSVSWWLWSYYYPLEIFHVEKSVFKRLKAAVEEHETDKSLLWPIRGDNLRRRNELRGLRGMGKLSLEQTSELSRCEAEHEALVAEQVRILHELARI